MKLNKEQITELKAYISKRGFTYTDVQLEILDHLACKVEEKMAADDTLAFGDALTAAHRDFGVMGFSTLEDAMSKGVSVHLRQVMLEVLRRWFSGANVLLVLGFALLMGMAYYFISNPYLCFAGIIIVYLLWAAYFFVSTRKDQRRFKNMLAFSTACSYVGVMGGPMIIGMNTFGQYLNNVSWGSSPFVASFFALVALFIVYYLFSMCRFYQQAKARCEEITAIY